MDWPEGIVVATLFVCIAIALSVGIIFGVNNAEYVKLHNQQIVETCLSHGQSAADCRQLLFDQNK